MSGLVKSLNNYTRLDIIVNPQINVWNNERSVELKIEDVAIRDADSPEAMIASAETLDQPQLRLKTFGISQIKKDTYANCCFRAKRLSCMCAMILPSTSSKR